MQKWIYWTFETDGKKVIKILGEPPDQPWEFHEYLEEQGGHGWEVAGVAGLGTSTFMVILKRPFP